jgi:hypothetical protein
MIYKKLVQNNTVKSWCRRKKSKKTKNKLNYMLTIRNKNVNIILVLAKLIKLN